MFRRIVSAAAVVAAAVIVSPVPASAGPVPAPGRLVHVHRCSPMSRPLVPPVAGYIVRDTAGPGRPFYRDSGSLTSGLFVGQGGTWVLVMWCRR